MKPLYETTGQCIRRVCGQPGPRGSQYSTPGLLLLGLLAIALMIVAMGLLAGQASGDLFWSYARRLLELAR